MLPHRDRYDQGHVPVIGPGDALLDEILRYAQNDGQKRSRASFIHRTVTPTPQHRVL